MSTIKVDIVRPVTTDGSLSLKGDSSGSATTNGISVDSSGNTSITGTTTTSTASLDGAVTINDSGADVDFRVESDTVNHALFVQGSDGYVGIGVSSPADKLHVDGNIRLSATYGINFSDYGATADSNLLDDYEEGTWTPSYTNLTTTGTVTHSGTYTKIGRLVYITATITRVSGDVGTTGGSTQITNLPFPVSTTQALGGSARVANILSSGGSVVSDSGSGSLWPPTISLTPQNLAFAALYFTT